MSAPKPKSTIDPEFVAVRAAAAAIEPFRDDLKRTELLWRVAKALELATKDLRPCCPNDDAPCIHDKEPCRCWACKQLRTLGMADVNREPRRSTGGTT